MSEECKIVETKEERIAIKLFDEEIEEAQFLCYLHDLSYEQLFVTLIKEKLDEMGIVEKDGKKRWYSSTKEIKNKTDRRKNTRC